MPRPVTSTALCRASTSQRTYFCPNLLTTPTSTASTSCCPCLLWSQGCFGCSYLRRSTPCYHYWRYYSNYSYFYCFYSTAVTVAYCFCLSCHRHFYHFSSFASPWILIFSSICPSEWLCFHYYLPCHCYNLDFGYFRYCLPYWHCYSIPIT